MAGGGPSSGAPKKHQRPVLPSQLAHAHAFATIPTPGTQSAVKSTNSYFPLPTPPAPLRSFTLPQNGASAQGTEGTTSYPTSLSSRRDGESGRFAIDQGENEGRAASRPEALDQKAARTSSKGSSKAQTHSRSSASAAGTSLQFASAGPFSVSRSGSPFVSSPGAHSARSALSIAEIDCFFVQGSLSSTYSVRSNPQSRSASQSDHSVASISDFGLSSSEDQQSDIWTSDEAERERQRAERQAFMKARKEAKDELRRKNRISKGRTLEEPTSQAALTWREPLQTQKPISLGNIPKSRHSTHEHRREENRPSSPIALVGAVPPAEPPSMQPPPSGPGPPQPPHSSLPESNSLDTLPSDLPTNLTLSTLPSSEPLEASNDEVPKGESPPGDADTPTPPLLSRFNSDETEVGT